MSQSPSGDKQVTLPTVGRIVHYVSYGTPGGEYSSECRAAIVTATREGAPVEGAVALAILNPTGMFFNQALKHDEEQAAGTWHWPCVVTS